MAKQMILDIRHKLIGDLFAGGGGASCGIEQATGLYVDFAVNHDPEAIAMHTANHPQTRHYIGDVYEVDPHQACGGRPIGLLHLSPDCTHHSQAAGGQPRDKATRSLSWVGVRYAGQVRPEVITLENVEQIRKWGPLVAKRDPATGRVIKRDHTIAAPGEVVPVHEQYLVPCKKKQGRTWRRFIRTLEQMGYTVEHRVLVAADYGAPTTRKRLYMVARCDGQPIVWPTPTHAEKPSKGQKPWRSAAECIDFGNTGQSIFARKKPLAENTLRRIAKGVKKFVLDSDDPFIVKFRANATGHSIREPLPTITSGGNAKRPAGAAHALGLATPVLAPSIIPIAHYNGSHPVHAIDKPLPTITAQPKGGSFALLDSILAPITLQAAYGEGTGATARRGIGSRPINTPLPTVTTTGSGGQAVVNTVLAPLLIARSHGDDRKRWGSGCHHITMPFSTICAKGNGDHSLIVPYLMQANGGFNTVPGRSMAEPVSTVTNSGSQQQLIAACLMRQFGTSSAGDIKAPMGTVMTGGSGKTGLIECSLDKTDVEQRALRVADFIISYYGNDDTRAITTPRDRLALVTVYVQGEPHYIVDIRLRMLTPAELYKAQGFPTEYIFDRDHTGKPLTKTAQVRMCGNSVSPPVLRAIITANYQPENLVKCANAA